MKKIDVLILVEHRARELETAVLLKYELEKRNYKVEISSIKFNKESVVFKYLPRVVVVPWAYTDKEMNLFSGFNRFGNKAILVNMHHEQLSNKGSESFIIPQETAVKIYHVSWGKYFTKNLIEVGSRQEWIIESGNPKFDFYRHPLIQFSKTKAEMGEIFNIDSNKRWILFIANAFHLFSETQIKINMQKGVDIIDQIESSKRNRDIFLSYVENVLDTNDEFVFIYRPHPSFTYLDKNSPEIKRLEKKFPNFLCISSGSIRDWLTNIDCSISFHSTAAIESSLINKPFYLFREYPLDSKKDYEFFNDYDYIIRNYDDFLDAIKGDSFNGYRDFQKKLDPLLSLSLNKPAYVYISNFIENILVNSKPNETNIKYSLKLHLKLRVIGFIKNMLYYISKFPVLGKIFRKFDDIRVYNLLKEGDDWFDDLEIDMMMKKLNRYL